MPVHYSDPSQANDPHALPNVETFKHICTRDGCVDPCSLRGWYYGDHVGPFPTEADALADAQSTD